MKDDLKDFNPKDIKDFNPWPYAIAMFVLTIIIWILILIRVSSWS